MYNQGTVQITQYEYDANGNTSKIIDPEGHATQHHYDALGNRTATIDARGNKTEYTYDDLNRLTMITDPLGFTTEYTYDANGNRTREKKLVVKDNTANLPSAYQITEYAYDTRDRLIAETRMADGGPVTTQYEYDRNDNRTQVIDPLQRVTKLTYDSQNRVTRITDPASFTTLYSYDKVGNRTTVVDAENHYTYSEYDDLNRLVKEIKKIGDRGPTADADDIVTWHIYDAGAAIANCQNAQCAGPIPGSSNIALTVDPEGKYTYFKYDAVNRKVMTLKKVGNTSDARDADDWTEIVQYDAVGNVLSKIDANGNAMTYAFDRNNRRTAEANALGETTR